MYDLSVLEIKILKWFGKTSLFLSAKEESVHLPFPASRASAYSSVYHLASFGPCFYHHILFPPSACILTLFSLTLPFLIPCYKNFMITLSPR